jgi:hypothetical protein
MEGSLPFSLQAQNLKRSLKLYKKGRIYFIHDFSNGPEVIEVKKAKTRNVQLIVLHLTRNEFVIAIAALVHP